MGDARHDLSWVNIVEDPDGAKFVSTYHDGDETVPTAVTGSGEMINPTPGSIKVRLRAAG